MRYDSEDGKKALRRTQTGARRTLASIQTALIPELSEKLPYRLMASQIQARIDAMSPQERWEMKVKVALALSDLETLHQTMTAQMDDLAAELRRIRGHRAAVSAYSHTYHSTVRPRRR